MTIPNIHSPKKWREPVKKPRAWLKILKKLFILGLVMVVLVWFSATVVLAWFSRDLPNPNKLIDRTQSQSTKIYDRTGEILLYEIFGNKKRTLIELKDVAEYAKLATITIEDKNFYNHRGLAWQSILRAAISNLLGRQTGRGGASTLTQQLIKNAILTNQKTYSRKIKEAILALQLERTYSKDEILKLYFNEIPYGSTNYGIEAASQSYFGKSARYLSLPEAATLAALPQAPTKYLNNLEALRGRRNYILDKMAESGLISHEEAEEAKTAPLKLAGVSQNIIAPHFVFFIKEQLTEQFSEQLIEQGGLKVITTLDIEKQKIAEEEIKRGVENNKKYKASNAALVAVDAKTGQILSMVGSADFFNEKIDGQVNVALRPRQPGSSFKPIVYAAAFEKGYLPQTKLYDVETVFKTEIGKDYVPHNYDGKERGIVTLRQALAGSLNIPAVKILYLTGVNGVLDLAEKLGYTTLRDRSRFGLSLVLGGAEIKLLDHVAAFTTLAREGSRVPLTSVLKIEDASGGVLEEWRTPSAEEVIKSTVVRPLTSILSDNEARSFIFGSGSPLILPDRPVAAKTGTTNDWRDGWTLGFTPSLVAGVWVGNNDNTPMAQKADGVYVAAPIWHNFMKRALKNTPVEDFTPAEPPPADTKPILLGQGFGDIVVNINKTNGLLASDATPPELVISKTYLIPHDLLFYINKDEPSGPPPSDPSADIQFANWEASVVNYAQKNGLALEEPPTVYDSGDASLTRPIIKIISPGNGETLNQRDLSIQVSVASSSTIKNIAYYLDETLLAIVSEPPFYFSTHLYETGKGFHSLRAVVKDQLGLTGEDMLDFNLVADLEPPTTVFLRPSDGAIFSRAVFPISLTLRAFQNEKIKKIVVYYTDEAGIKKTLTNINGAPEKTTIISWENKPPSGNYTLGSLITTNDNQTLNGREIRVVVN